MFKWSKKRGGPIHNICPLCEPNLKIGTKEQEFASPFFTGRQSTVQWEWWNAYFCPCSSDLRRNRQCRLGKSPIWGQAGAEPRPPLHVFTGGIKSPLADNNLQQMYNIRQGGLGCIVSKLTKDQRFPETKTGVIEERNQTAQMQLLAPCNRGASNICYSMNLAPSEWRILTPLFFISRCSLDFLCMWTNK